MCGTNFCTAARKILNSLSLRSRDRGHWPQNLRSKELRGKILTNKYLQFAHAMCVFGSGLTTSGRTVAESWRTFHYALSVLRVKVTCHKKAEILCGRLWKNLVWDGTGNLNPFAESGHPASNPPGCLGLANSPARTRYLLVEEVKLRERPGSCRRVAHGQSELHAEEPVSADMIPRYAEQ